MLPSLQLQLTSVSYSVFYYLSHSILLLKPKPKNCPLFPCSSTSNPSQGAISSTAESVCSSPSLPPPDPILDLLLNLPTLRAVPFQPAHYLGPEWTLTYGHWINRLPANFLLWLSFIYRFQSKVLTMVFKVLQDVQPHPLQSSPWVTMSNYSCLSSNCWMLLWTELGPHAQTHMLKL